MPLVTTTTHIDDMTDQSLNKNGSEGNAVSNLSAPSGVTGAENATPNESNNLQQIKQCARESKLLQKEESAR